LDLLGKKKKKKEKRKKKENDPKLALSQFCIFQLFQINRQNP